MTKTAEIVLRDALTLNEGDRAALAGILIDSLETEPEDGVEEAWTAEIDRRVGQLDSGEIKTVAWEGARARLGKKARGTSSR